MFHFSLRMFGRLYTLQHDDIWTGRDLGPFWSYREPSGAVRYHCGAWVLWVERAAIGCRVELECGRFALSF